MSQSITFTLWQDKSGFNKRELVLPWSEIPAVIRDAGNRKAKLDCPMIKFATFGDIRNAKPTPPGGIEKPGSLRHDGNVLAVTGIEGDYDGEIVSPDEAIDRLERHKIRAYLATTYTNRPGRPRWRVFAPLSRPVAPAERLRYAQILNGALDGILAPESADLSRAYFVGWPPGIEPVVLTTFTDADDGYCLDDLDHGDEIRQPFVGKPKPATEGQGGQDGDYLAELLAGEDLHANARKLVGKMVYHGYDAKLIQAMFEGLKPDIIKARGPERTAEFFGGELLRLIEGAIDKGYAPPPPVDPSIILATAKAKQLAPTPPAAWPDPRPLPRRGDQGQAMPFPLDLLPEGVQRAAREVGRFVKVPPAAPALVGLAVLAVAIGKRAVVEERPGLHHSPASFFVGIAASGERKSPVFRTMTAPLEEWTQQAIQDWGTANKEAQANGQAVDAAIRGLKARAKDGIAVEQLTAEIADLEGKRVIAPPYPRLFTTDTTEQRLFQLMHERDGAFAVLSGEGRPVVDALLGKYSGEGRTGDGIFLAGVSGDIITRDRVGGEGGPEERIIHNPCLTTCILVQPDKYLEAANHRSLRASGALARIWPVLLPSLVGTRLEAVGELGLNAAEMANYHNSVTQILGFNPPTDDHERPIPHRVTLGPEATEARRQFHNAIETEMIAGGDLDDVRDLASKATTQTTKLAMILHLAQHPIHLEQGVSEIGPTTWAMAQKLGTWFLEEATRVQRLADEDPAIEDARRVLAWLASDDQRETITASEISQIGPRPRPSGDKAREILELLHDYNWLQPETLPGKRKPIWRLHPKLASLANLARESVSE